MIRYASIQHSKKFCSTKTIWSISEIQVLSCEQNAYRGRKSDPGRNISIISNKALDSVVKARLTS